MIDKKLAETTIEFFNIAEALCIAAKKRIANLERQTTTVTDCSRASLNKNDDSEPLTTTLAEIEGNFPSTLKAQLDFSIVDKKVFIKPKRFLDSAEFAAIAAIVSSLQGCYVSAGKAPHFQVLVE